MLKVQRAHGLGVRANSTIHYEELWKRDLQYIVVTEFNKSTEYNIPFFEL